MTNKKLLKIGGIVFTKDPEDNYRLLLRHNRPFNGHMDHWTIVSGTVDPGETDKDAVIREVGEEFSLEEFLEIIDLEYRHSLQVKEEVWEISYYALHVKDIEVQITLEWESIGYNWVTFNEAKNIIQEDFVRKAIDLLETRLVS